MNTPRFCSCFVLLLVISVPTDGQAKQGQTTHGQTTHSQTKQEKVLRAYVDVWNTGDVNQLADLVTDDFTRHGSFGPADSRQALEQVILNSRRFYRDLHIELDQVVANPHKGAMRWRFTGGWDDTRFSVDSINFGMVHFRDGKIAEEWILGNTLDLFKTFGYRLTSPQAKINPPPITEPPGPTLQERLASRHDALANYAERSRRQAPEDAGQLKIRTQVGCQLVLDDQPIGWLPPEGSMVIPLSRGKHLLQATSLGGSPIFERRVTLRPGATTTVDIKASTRLLVDSRQGTAEDLTTGLMWQTRDNRQDITLPAAQTYCEQLTQGGYTGWRLPTIHELTTLQTPKSSKRYRSIKGIELSDCCPWTSTPHGDFTWTYAFSMDMRYLQYEALGYHMRALCVRDPAETGPRD